ncbi:hypothetical protein RJ640_018703 [Escallonia rubra]|uniref:Uncharacterized protein n=1 Tax=Escallonia rubra TaxID=112253 RepID=A0AA88RBN7_9ASTE|nr:hypothetical protein RJ640_018703 [Escallonia rubra]
MASGILSSGVSFLWVMKKTYKDSGVLPEGFLEKAGDQGKEWSPQEQVLAHPSVSCFVTHCGWNSTMEALSSGVPVVAFPKFGDQIGRSGKHNNFDERGGEVLAGGDKQFKGRGDEGKCIKVEEGGGRCGGSSERNVKAFVDEVRRRSVGVKSMSTNC